MSKGIGGGKSRILSKEGIKQGGTKARMQWVREGNGVCVSRLVVSYSLRPMNYSLPGSSVHGILQARILEWVGISYSKGREGSEK